MKPPETVWRTMGKSQHWPQHRIRVGRECTQNRRCVTVWDRRFSCLFVYVRGKTAPSIFQATMDKIWAGIDNVFFYVDDVLIPSKTREEHTDVLQKVFHRLEKYNVKLNAAKCQFYKPELKYLGYVLCSEGVRPVQSKIDAVRCAPRPQNVTELKSFLGMVNFYGKFVPKLSEELHPLYAILNKNPDFIWSEECKRAFDFAKNVVTGDRVLVHFDPEKPVIVSVDASPYGLGAVLSHKMEDGSERPIAYASRTLSKAEKNYAQIVKEGLAIIFGMKKFHLYLYGRPFELITDHQPLTRIFGPKAGIPTLAAARMQRWALLLSGYQYDVRYRSSNKNANADLLSRLPLRSKYEKNLDEHYVFHTVVDSLPVTAKRVQLATQKDRVLSKVYEFTLHGWANQCADEVLRPYWLHRHELSIEDGCILWGRGVILPVVLQKQMLEELHVQCCQLFEG